MMLHIQIDIKFTGRWCKSNILQRRKNCLIFNFQGEQTAVWRDKTQRGQKNIVNQSKPILVLVRLLPLKQRDAS